jgi:glucokinase
MPRYLFGIDVGGTTVKCGLFRTDGTLLEKWEIPTRTEENGRHILPDVAETVRKKIRERGLGKEEIAGLGIGVPGPVTESGEVSTAVNIHWGRKHVTGELEEALGLPVKAGNDANVAALGEMWAGGGKGASSLIMVTLGTGVGGGVIVNGKIVAGAHGAGGEIGHGVIVPEETEVCNCGNHGCVEQMASATGIARLARRYRQELDASLPSADGEGPACPAWLRKEDVTARDVFDAYKEGDPAAAVIVSRFADHLGRAMAFCACVTDPEVFVIGGGVSRAGESLLQVLKEHYRKYAFPACRDTEMVLAELGNDAGIYGAARLMLDSIGEPETGK